MYYLVYVILITYIFMVDILLITIDLSYCSVRRGRINKFLK